MRRDPSPFRDEPFWPLFYQQRKNARARGIDWDLSYPQWIKIWLDSGHFQERGRQKGQYHMARFGDRGPYVIGNVKIIAMEDNGREAHKGRRLSKKRRAEISANTKASWDRLSKEERAVRGRAVSAGQLKTGGNKRAWQDPTKRNNTVRGMKNAWKRLSKAERIAWGKAVSEGKRRACRSRAMN